MKKHLTCARLYLISLLLFLASLLTSAVQAEQQEAKKIFNKWLSSQKIYADVDVAAIAQDIPETNIPVIASAFAKELQPQLGFLHIPFSQMSPDASAANEKKGHSLNMTKKDLKKTAQAIKFLFSAVDSNPGNLLARLKEENFSSAAINTAEEAADNTKIIEKYRNLFETLVYSAGSQQSQATLFAIANRFYEYCFSSSSFEEFSTYIKNPKYYPIARMVYANTWYYLSSIGWQIWHINTLTALREQYEKEKEILYIAGGTDIYQLLQNGIFRIRVIDPIFPSQTTYYSEGWEFLIKGNTPDGGLGDTITMDYKGKQLILKRTSYTENGSFKTPELSDSRMHTIPKSTTVWTIYNERKKILGTYTLERRFVEQNDFADQKKRIFLISFNELYFVTTSSKINWGIDVRNFDPKITIYVKQLRKPVSRPMLINFRKAEDYPFSFIQFGTKIN